ncbi:MAG TPA: hypothetical protein VH234_04275 [Candidatus Saccharimonadales bacterium]|nr:hypothetical protein [Candidatus Saccharimonadales bacterium]
MPYYESPSNSTWPEVRFSYREAGAAVVGLSLGVTADVAIYDNLHSHQSLLASQIANYQSVITGFPSEYKDTPGILRNIVPRKNFTADTALVQQFLLREQQHKSDQIWSLTTNQPPAPDAYSEIATLGGVPILGALAVATAVFSARYGYHKARKALSLIPLRLAARRVSTDNLDELWARQNSGKTAEEDN